MALLEIEDLCTYFFTHRGTVQAVDGINLSVDSGRTIGIVGSRDAESR